MSRSAQIRDAHVEDDADRIIVVGDEVYRDAIIAVSEEQYRQMWSGYMCSFCCQPWETPWPERCPMGCFLFGEKVTPEAQHRYMTLTYGETWLGPSKATVERWANEAERL